MRELHEICEEYGTVFPWPEGMPIPNFGEAISAGPLGIGFVRAVEKIHDRRGTQTWVAFDFTPDLRDGAKVAVRIMPRRLVE